MLTPPYSGQHIQTHCSLKVYTFRSIRISVSSLPESSVWHCCAFLHEEYNLIYSLNSANFQTDSTKFLSPLSLCHQATNKSKFGTSVHYLCTQGTWNSTAHKFTTFNHMPWVKNKYYSTKTFRINRTSKFVGKTSPVMVLLRLCCSFIREDSPRALSDIISPMFHISMVQVQACEPHVIHWQNFCGPTLIKNTKYLTSHWYIWLKPALDQKKCNVSFSSIVFFNPILSNPLSISLEQFMEVWS